MALPQLLWIDDDGPRRFKYEQAVLRDTWAISWSNTVKDAAQKLARQIFGAVLLDQMLPPDQDHRPDVWGGCALLTWLVSGTVDAGIPSVESYHFLTGLEYHPLTENRSAPVCVVSAYDNRTVIERMKESKPDLPVEAKPIELENLQAFLKRANAGSPT